MKKIIRKLLLLCVVTASILNVQAAETYDQALKKMMAEKAKQPSPFTQKDREVMEQAGIKLANNMPNPGIAVGQVAPDFTLTDAFGQQVNLKNSLKNGPVILVFYRGAWCPFCNLHLHALKARVPEFKKHNAQLIAITPQKPDKSAAEINEKSLPFKVLSDLDSQVMKNYNLYFEIDAPLISIYKRVGIDLEDFNGKGRNVLPVPGTFVIDQKGVVRAMQAETDYTKRMEPDAILDALNKL